MIARRTLLALGLALAASSSPAWAAPAAASFTQAAFDAAQKAGKPILVEIHADWCPTCKAQAPIVSELRDQPRFKDLVVFRVDYDAQKDIVKRFGARMQSTLITFKGATETGRSVGETGKSAIETLLAKAI